MKRVIVAKKVLRSSDAVGEFDGNFWRRSGHEARFTAAWEMVREVRLMRGEKNVGQQRLQRSVQNIERRKS